jgi:hypothetical protein
MAKAPKPETVVEAAKVVDDIAQRLNLAQKEIEGAENERKAHALAAAKGDNAARAGADKAAARQEAATRQHADLLLAHEAATAALAKAKTTAEAEATADERRQANAIASNVIAAAGQLDKAIEAVGKAAAEYHEHRRALARFRRVCDTDRINNASMDAANLIGHASNAFRIRDLFNCSPVIPAKALDTVTATLARAVPQPKAKAAA